MKSIVFLLLYFTAFSQQSISSNIYMTDFTTNTDAVYTNEKGGLVTFSKVYADVMLKPHNIPIDSDELEGNISSDKKKYKYYLKCTFYKDTVYKTSEVVLLDNYDPKDLTKLKFNKFTSETSEIFAPCGGREVYTDVLISIGFEKTGAVILLDNGGKTILLKLLTEDCYSGPEEHLDKEAATYCITDTFLALLYHGHLIIVNDR